MITHVTYSHKDKPFGDRFRQRLDVPLPRWATQIKFEFTQPVVLRILRFIRVFP